MNSIVVKAFAGVVLLFASAGMWAYATIEQMHVAGEVRAAMRTTGQPPRFWPAKWGEWRQGSTGLATAPQAPKRLQSARIAEHRVGRAQVSFFNAINLYQARYVYPDGRAETWLAQGPRAPVVKPIAFLIVIAAMLLAGIGSLVLAWRDQRREKKVPANLAREGR